MYKGDSGHKINLFSVATWLLNNSKWQPIPKGWSLLKKKKKKKTKNKNKKKKKVFFLTLSVYSAVLWLSNVIINK